MEENIIIKFITDTSELGDVRRELGLVEGAEDDLRKSIDKANKSAREQGDATADGAKKSKRSIEELRKELKTFELAKSNAFDPDEIKKFDAEIKKLEKSIGEIDSGGSGSRGGGLKGIISRVGGLKNAIAGGVIVGAFAAIGKAVFDVQQRIEGARKEAASFSKATGDELSRITAQAQTLADVYDRDIREVLESTNVVANAFGISFEEAGEKIENAFIKGLDRTGELLAVTREYPLLLKEAGLSADEFFQIIETGLDQGVFNDKAIDSIKEANIRLRELTPATRDALNGIGISADQVQRALADGSKTTFDIVQDVSRALNEFPADSARVGTAIADIFGGPGEDAGLKFLRTLKDIDGQFDTNEESLTDFQKSQKRLVDATQRLNLVYNRLFSDADGGFSSLKATVIDFAANALETTINGVIKTINFFRELRNDSIIFRGLIEGITAAAKIGFELFLTPLELAIEGVKTFGSAVGALLTGDFSDIPGIIAEGAANGIDIIEQSGKDIGNALIDGYNETVKPAELLEPFKLLGEREAGEAGENVGEEIAEGIGRGIGKSRGIIQDLEAELKSLKAARDQSRSEREITAINERIALLTEELNVLRNLRNLQQVDGSEANLFDNARKAIEALDKRAGFSLAFRKQLNKERIENEQETQEIINGIAQEAFDFGIGITNLLNQIKQQGLQQELDQELANRDRLLEAAGDNEQQRIRVLEASERREREIKRRQAETQKRQARFDILTDTARGVGKAIATYPFPVNLIPIAFALTTGAAQLAVVNKAQVPAFEQGVKNFTGGWAVVGEAGPELINEPGRSYLSGDGAELRYLPRGTDVIPNGDFAPDDVKEISRSNVPFDILDTIGRGSGNKRIEDKLDRLIKVSSRNRTTVINRNDTAWKQYVKNRYN